MRDALNKLVAALSLITILAILAAVVFLSNAKQVVSDIEGGIKSAVLAIGAGLEIIFFTGLVLGVAYVGIFLIKKWKEQDTHVIRDGKDGQVARALVHRGQVVQIMDLSADPNLQIEHFSKLFTMAQKAVQASNKLNSGYDEIEASIPLQIAQSRPTEEYLRISDDYQPHADEFLSEKKLVVGTTGSGKSNSIGTLCEELGRLNVPMILADTENEYEPLCNPRWFPHGILADCSTVNPDNAAQFGQYVLEQNLQVILNLQSYPLEEGAYVMVNLIAGLKQWQEERANELRIPCEFLLEEATTWLPQNVKESSLNGTEVMSRLQDAFFNDMVRKGRKRGLGLTVICQKIAEIDKRALQCGVKLLHRQTELIDLDKYNKMGIGHEETLSLQNGEGYFFSSKVSKLRMQVRRRRSDHGANTPGLDQLRRHQQTVRNFGEIRNGDEGFRNDFGPLTEPVRNISNISDLPFKMVPGSIAQVPEETKSSIVRLYERGYKRIKIQEALDLNGDEYWMIKAVCDEHDRIREEA